MPEIAAAWLVGALITFIAVNINLYWVHRTFQGPALKTLNHNLSKVNRYWSIEQGRLMEMNSPTQKDELGKRDYRNSTRSAFLFGTMMIVLSWFGLFLFVLYVLSTYKFAKSRLEQRVFASELMKDENLSSDQVGEILVEIESLS